MSHAKSTKFYIYIYLEMKNANQSIYIIFNLDLYIRSLSLNILFTPLINSSQLAPIMARFSLWRMMAIAILLFVMVEAQPYKPKQVKCKDKNGYPMCSGSKFTCPAACPRSCMADCELCRAVCSKLNWIIHIYLY